MLPIIIFSTYNFKFSRCVFFLIKVSLEFHKYLFSLCFFDILEFQKDEIKKKKGIIIRSINS